MKKLIILIFLMLMGIGSWAEDIYSGSFLLLHNGDKTGFKPTDFPLLMEQAVEGDTVMMGRGLYPEITLSKNVKLIGPRDGYSINLRINIPDMDSKDILIESIPIYTLYLDCNFDQLTLRHSYITDRIVSNSQTPGKITLDKCNIYMWNVENEPPFNAIQSSVNVFLNGNNTDNSKYVFTNCEIQLHDIGDGTVPPATYINSVFYDGRFNSEDGTTDPQVEFSNSIFESCLFDNTGRFYINESCTENNSYSMEHQNWNCSKENLESLGFLGNDGTVVGRYGTANEYRYDMERPGGEIQNITTNGNKMDVRLWLSPSN